jgi:hydroxyacylglutathione hydrolase
MRHLLNVPAGKISALSHEPTHFLDWIRKNYDSAMTEADFAPRTVFGRYIKSLITATAGIRHLRTTVRDVRLEGAGAVVTLVNGRTLTADAVVLATGNFDPAPLNGVSEQAMERGIYCHSAWDDATYANLTPDAPVVLIGTGLTAVDVILRLREIGHRGVITAISRHGIFPKRHAQYVPLAEGVITGTPPAKARGLLHAVHEAIRSGMSWRAVVDSLRARTNQLWLALPLAEQQRFRRHLQRHWEVVRHRMAPPIADVIETELAVGALVIRRGSLEDVVLEGDGARVNARAATGETLQVTAQRVINCTGPNMNYRRVGSALLESLFAQGLVTAGPHGGGLWSDQDGALRSSDGSFSKVLFNVGPGRQGTLLESIAVPELRDQAVMMADRLAAQRWATSASVSSFTRAPHDPEGPDVRLSGVAGRRP